MGGWEEAGPAGGWLETGPAGGREVVREVDWQEETGGRNAAVLQNSESQWDVK